jgi:beta-mannosidase
VWGGGLREKEAFYALCDEMGLLLWQEFPLACAFATRYPRTPEYLALVHAETRAIVRDLRNHPSILLWCGGNEFSPGRNRPVVEAMSRAAAEDPSRPFWPASPHRLDSHNWAIWHCFEAPSAYRRDLAGFASEFGLQAPPSVEALRRFIPPDELWPPGPAWTYHSAGLDKLRRYAQPLLRPGDDSLEEFVRASQQAQALGLQIAIEHYRRRKAEGCGGALVWQLNEPWPAICWALLDYYREPKPAYETVKRVFSPILVSLDYSLRAYHGGDSLAMDVWLINDTIEAAAGCELEIALVDGAGRRGQERCLSVDVTPSSARVVDRVEWTLPAGEGWRVICCLVHKGRVLSENEYDLAAHDGLGPKWWQRTGVQLGKMFIPA